MVINQIEYYSQVRARRVEWLWYPYIPYGKLTVIQGDPGEGKSTLILNIAALLSTGQPMPDGSSVEKPQTIIYQCAEDSVEDTIKPRLVMAGADCDKVAFIVEEDDTLTLTDERIENAIKNTGAKLFILDPIQAFIPPDADMLSATKMRSTMRKLAGVAEKYKCAIVLIGHMNKAGAGKNMYRGLGSIDIAAIARSILMVARDEANPQIRYVFPVKSSLAPEGSAIGFRIGGDSKIEWLGKVDINTKQFEEDSGIKLSKNELAKRYILELLGEGDMLGKDVYAKIAEFGIKSRTVETAKKELGIVTYRKGNAWYWKLPRTY